MMTRSLRRVAVFAAAALIAVGCAHAPAADPAQDPRAAWSMATEYPASSMPGLGVADFAERVQRLSGGSVRISPSFDASAGVKSAAMLDAVRNRRVDAADAFAGALGTAYPLLGLSSLPFVADSLPRARALLDAARPAYERLLAAQGQRLLYTTPWPASGIWSKAPLARAADLEGLRIRTYDDVSQAVLSRAGAQAVNISFADAMPRIASGDVNAVLSSGDGGAGRKLWQYLPHFTEINYAMPISIATVNSTAWSALTRAQQHAVERAARETEASQWQRMETRLSENYANMRANGVQINTAPAADLRGKLREAARDAVNAWRAKAGPEGVAILERIGAR